MYIYEEIYHEILCHYPPAPPENGGILGQKNGIICAYLHDPKPQAVECATYIPDVEWMNISIQKWSASGIEFAGIVHSHPPEYPTLSGPDRTYICTIMAAMPSYISELFFPILIPGEGMYAYKAVIHPSGVTIRADIITYIEYTDDIT